MANKLRKCCGTPNGQEHPHAPSCLHNEANRQLKDQPITPLRRKRGDADPDWTKTCKVCGQAPVLPLSGMCGPCTTGDADTVGGEW